MSKSDKNKRENKFSNSKVLGDITTPELGPDSSQDVYRSPIDYNNS